MIANFTVHSLVQAEVGGLTRDRAAPIIATVGNHREIYERTVGMASPVTRSRGLDALWSQGGPTQRVPLQ